LSLKTKPKALVTGGAGFIGSHLCEALLRANYSVQCYDDLSHGSPANIEHLTSNSDFHFCHADVCDRAGLKKATSNAWIIIHLAARKIPRYGDALSTLRVNNEGTRNVLELAASQNIKVVLASTSDVYGKGTPPFKESDDLIIGPSDVRRWSYAASKIFDEHLAQGYFYERNLPTVTLRFFGSYGPRNHRSWWGGPQAVFIEQALRGEPFSIHGDGSQTRSFTYIDDLIAGIMAASEKEAAIGQIINLGSEEEVTILELANIINELIWPGKTPKIKFIPYESFGGRYEDVKRRLPDLTKARKILGFNWTIKLRDGLLKTIAWHKNAPPPINLPS
jgi:UDP-glucose 4-epimerase